jgi:hypothetical protein
MFFAASLVFVWRSFYGMRIRGGEPPATKAQRAAAVAG